MAECSNKVFIRSISSQRTHVDHPIPEFNERPSVYSPGPKNKQTNQECQEFSHIRYQIEKSDDHENDWEGNRGRREGGQTDRFTGMSKSAI